MKLAASINTTLLFGILLVSSCREAAKNPQESSLESKVVLNPGESFSIFRELCQQGDEAGVRIMIRNGADVDGVNDYRISRSGEPQEDIGWGFEPSWPINDASWGGHLGVVRLLLEAGAEIDQPEGEGYTALWIAASKGHKQLVIELLAAGANPSFIGANRWTPAEVARKYGHDEVYQIIREQNNTQHHKSDRAGGSKA